MPRDARTDGPHAEIRDGLRALGVFVIDTHTQGHGFPDLVPWTPQVGWQLLEVKSPGGTLTKAERKLHEECPGPIWIVRTLEDAAAKMGLEVEGVSDDILTTFLAWLEPDSGAFDMGRAQQASLRGLLEELQERRSQRCETCAAWEPFSDDPAFSADEDLWCVELERFKAASGYCDQWRAKEAAK